jgi:hypothetical protein
MVNTILLGTIYLSLTELAILGFGSQMIFVLLLWEVMPPLLMWPLLLPDYEVLEDSTHISFVFMPPDI